MNIILDFLLLLSVSILLKRKTKFKRIIYGSIAGGLSILFLFIKLTSIELLILKILISMLMILIAFGYRNIKYFINNLIYLYILSIILGGFLYLLKVEFTYKNSGILFFNNEMSINFIVLLIISPVILYIYVKEVKKLKINYNHYYKVDIYYENKIYKFIGYLDTGNKLYDQYKHRPIVLINTKDIDFNIEKNILVPYKTASGEGIVKCLAVDKMVIENREYKNLLIGLSSKGFDIDGIDMILHSEIIGG